MSKRHPSLKNVKLKSCVSCKNILLDKQIHCELCDENKFVQKNTDFMKVHQLLYEPQLLEPGERRHLKGVWTSPQKQSPLRADLDTPGKMEASKRFTRILNAGIFAIVLIILVASILIFYLATL